VFFYFAHLEETGEAASINAAIALLYKLGGKWLVTSVCALLGMASLIGGIVGVLKARQ
jgi:hypothetical protein